MQPVIAAAPQTKSPGGLTGSTSNPSIFRKVAASAKKVMSSRSSKKQSKAREEDFRILEETLHSPPDNVQEHLREMV